MKRLLALLLLSLTASATTTVTGHIQNLGTSGVSNGAFVRFWLRGCGGNQPTVSGSGVIAPSQGGVFYFDIPAGASGAVSGTIYSTRDATGNNGGDISCGGSTTSVWYGMQIFQAGKGGPEVAIHAKNTGTLDVTSVTPITTNPVVTAPTGDTTYARLDAGNQPFLGSVNPSGDLSLALGNSSHRWNASLGSTTVQKLNGLIVYADQYSGATFDAKISAAITALGSLRGTVDARGLVTGCTAGTSCGTIAATIAIPSQVTVLWPQSSGWITCTISNNTPCITMVASSSLVCNGIGTNFCQIKVGNGASIQAMLQTGNNASFPIENMYVAGMQFTQDTSATVSDALCDVISTYDSVFDRMNCAEVWSNSGNTNKALWIHDASASIGDNAVEFYQPYIQGGLWVTSDHGGQVNMLRFYGGDIQHRIGTSAGVPGNNIIHIDGVNHIGGVSGIYFYGGYNEQGSADLDTTTALITIKDAGNVAFYGGQMNIAGGYTPGGSNGAITVSQSGGTCASGAQCTFDIAFKDYIVAGLSGGQNTIYAPVDPTFTVTGGQQALNWIYQNLGSYDTPIIVGAIKAHRLNLSDKGQCTMSSGTCTAQNFGSTYSSAPLCFATWTGTGTLAGSIKITSSTTQVTPSSSTGSDSAQVNWACYGF